MLNEMKRRDFLKLAGTAALAVSAAGILTSCSEGGVDSPSSSSSKPSSSSSSASSSSSSASSSSSSEASSSSQGESTLRIIWSTRDNGDGTATLIGYENSGADPVGRVTLPTEWMGRTITGVDGNLGGRITELIVPGTYEWVAGLSSNNLQKVTIREGVKELRNSAFAESSKLVSVSLPDTLKTMGRHSFYRCGNLTSINIPKNLKTLGIGALEECPKLTAITLPEGLEELLWRACRNSGFVSVTVPSTIKNFESEVFSFCNNLVDANIKCTTVGEATFDGCSKLSSVTLAEDTLKVPNYMFRNCTSLSSIRLPKNLKEIGNYAFQNCKSLRTVTFPTNTTVLREGAFYGMNLQSIRIPYGTTEIPRMAFLDCELLNEVHIPVTVTSIGRDAFGKTRPITLYYEGNKEQWSTMVSVDIGNGTLGAGGIKYSQY